MSREDALLKYTLEAIRERLRTQGDWHVTSHPMYLVQQKRRDYGYDPDLSDWANIVWIDEEGEEADEEQHKHLETRYRSQLYVSDNWTRTSYQDRWEYVQVFFTEAAAREYIERNKHNLNEPRVYVDSGYRNPEWQAVRDFLMEGKDEQST